MPNDSIWEEVFGRVDASGYLVPLYACLETRFLTIHECAMVHYSLREARCAQRACALRAIRHAHSVWTSTGVTVQKEAKNENACLKQCYSHIKEQHSQNPRHHAANVNVLCDVSMCLCLPHSRVVKMKTITLLSGENSTQGRKQLQHYNVRIVKGNKKQTCVILYSTTTVRIKRSRALQYNFMCTYCAPLFNTHFWSTRFSFCVGYLPDYLPTDISSSTPLAHQWNMLIVLQVHFM